MERLAELGLDISQGQYSRIERGESPYNQDFMEKVAVVYGCTAADLTERDPNDQTAAVIADLKKAMRKPGDPIALSSIIDNLKDAAPEKQREAARIIKALLSPDVLPGNK